MGEGEQTVFAWMMTVKTEEMRELGLSTAFYRLINRTLP